MTVGDVGQHRRAYEAGTATPTTVAERFLTSPPMGGGVDAFIAVDPDAVLAEAADSTARLARGEPRGPLEGVLVGVKDFFDVRGYVTRGGTRALVQAPARDAALVARLRAAGAVIAGKTRATELGLSPIGPNPSGGTPRNPHDPVRATGGSSSGSAAAVAAGLVPLAVGSDGGGSLRIPPALCGVFGFKPSFGAVPLEGEVDVGWYTLEHAGPIARSAVDLAEGYAVLADRAPARLDAADGVRVGVAWDWWGEPDRDVDRVCRAAIEDLHVVPVAIEHLDLVRIALYVTVAGEVGAAVFEKFRDSPEQFGPDVQSLLGAAGVVTAAEYVRAQQMRSLLDQAFTEAFRSVDILVTPTTACTAPVLPAEARETGLVDQPLLERLTQYAFAANLVGLPAASVPVGLDATRMPVGLQLIGRRGDDETVLSLAMALERDGVAWVPRPTRWQPTLDDATASTSSSHGPQSSALT